MPGIPAFRHREIGKSGNREIGQALVTSELRNGNQRQVSILKKSGA